MYTKIQMITDNVTLQHFSLVDEKLMVFFRLSRIYTFMKPPPTIWLKYDVYSRDNLTT